MINHPNRMFRLMVVAVAAAAMPMASANAQPSSSAAPAPPASAATPPAGTAAPAPPPAPRAGPGGTESPTVGGGVAVPLPVDDVPPGEAGSDDTAVRTNIEAPREGQTATGESPATAENGVPLVFPSAGVVRRRRVKPLRIGIGLDPTAPDFGGEADIVSTANEGVANIKPKRWMFTMHGFLRAPLTVGIGPSATIPARMDNNLTDHELHSPATHIVGRDNSDWLYAGLVPSPIGSLNISAGNAVISGTIIIAAQTFYDVGYKKLDQMGAISQGYLSMKFNDAFGYRGGLALNAGAFSNRYGLAGPYGNSSGYYNTYLFGRTRVAGANLVANLDLTDRWELVVEGGGGAKLEVVPWLTKSLDAVPYVPQQGATPQGSNFVWQLHPALYLEDWLKLAGHYMVSYSPNDLSITTGFLTPPIPSSRLTILGADVHVDRERLGHLYLGYSHIDGSNVLSLADGIQVLHASNGAGMVQNYFNPAWVPPAPGGAAIAPGTVGDSGKIDTVMFQYLVRLASLLELPATGRDLSVAVFGMFNHVTSKSFASGSQDKIKFGAEAQYAASRYLSAGVRFDRVAPDGGNADVTYSAISPRLIFHTNWLSREYLLLSYTRYMLGSAYGSVIQNDVTYQQDKNLLVLSAQIAF